MCSLATLPSKTGRKRSRQAPEVRCFVQKTQMFLPLGARRLLSQHSGGCRLFLRDDCSLSAKMNLTDRCQQLHFCNICNRFVDLLDQIATHVFFLCATYIYIYSIFDSPMILFHGCNFCLIPTMSPYNPRISQSWIGDVRSKVKICYMWWAVL
jgi:hypothetical protein